jgi:hypothetical protein
MLFSTGCKSGGEADEEAEASVDHAPHLSADLLPEPVGMVELGVATEADLVAAFPDADVRRNEELGGTGECLCMIGGDPVIIVERRLEQGEDNPLDLRQVSYWLVPDDESVPRLVLLKVRQASGVEPSVCDWLASQLEDEPQASVCEYEPELGEFPVDHCIGTQDGSRPIVTRCNRGGLGTTLEYWLK